MVRNFYCDVDSIKVRSRGCDWAIIKPLMFIDPERLAMTVTFTGQL